MIYTFISYSRKDIDGATRFEERLLLKGIKTWRDKNDIKGGEFWDDEIENALSDRAITHCLVLVSRNSLNSPNVKNEIVYAINEGKKVIPVIVGDYDKLPLNLIRRQAIDLRADFDQGIEELHELLKNNSEPQQPASVPPPTSHSILKLTPQQLLAARDEQKLVRVIAGPGTGKSLVIEERVRWLLSKRVDPETLYVVSFTRASSRDLRDRIVKYCTSEGISGGSQVSVTTLHSLALKVLRKAGLLHYPSEPQVLDTWELENIFDVEFSETVRGTQAELDAVTPSRAEEIRLAWEAYWNTGRWDPPNYIQPTKPVSQVEKEAFRDFHQATTQTYSCVLPGEIIKMCIDEIETGSLDPASILDMRHLIVDEFQDLNYTDLQFVDAFISKGIPTFVAGDDDQSIYSFRYAYPTGIQKFTQKYANVSDHKLAECFRCTPDILDAANQLIVSHKGFERIPKQNTSFCNGFEPQLRGIVYRWIFKSENAEFKAIATSCRTLIDKGIPPRNILILISNRKALLQARKEKPPLFQELFEEAGVPVDMPTGVRYVDTSPGRMVYSLIRVACDLNLHDYIAHRTLLGLLRGVGNSAYNGIRNKVVLNNLNYLDVFYNPLPDGIFNTTETRALSKVRKVCQEILEWTSEDILADRSDVIANMLRTNFDEAASQEWASQIAHLPEDMNLGELRSYLATENSEQQESIMEIVYKRLNIEIPEGGILPQQVRVMTMHGAKGLNADIVFVPGLEEDILPGEKRSRYTGLVQEAARMLYVSLTRSRVACMVSYSMSRMKRGERNFGRSHSRYCKDLAGKFVNCGDTGLTEDEAIQITDGIKTFKEHTKARLSQL